MNHYLALLILLLLPFQSFSQKDKDLKAFDSIFYHIAVNLSSSDHLKAMHLADSLFIYSINDNQRVKTLMLKADILEKQEKRGEAIQQAQKALEIAKREDDYSFQARIYGFLSTQYRNIGFLDKGKESINKGLEVSSKIENKESVTKYKAMANHELAEYALEEKNYKSAIEFLNLSMLAYDQEKNESLKYFFKSSIEEMFGRAYFNLNDIEASKSHFSRANYYINKANAGNSLWAGLIYQEYSNAFLKTNKIDSAKFYILKALDIAEKSNNGSLKESVYKTASNYYQQVRELDSFSKYELKFNKLLNENTAKKKSIVNSAYQTLNISNEETNLDENNKGYLGVILIFFSVLGVFVVLKRKTIFSKFYEDTETEVCNNSDINLSEKTESEILDKLSEFEASLDFLDKNMSMSILIGKLNTNIKYLRYILKKHKNSDYNTYINQLRIDYILEKLKSDPEYSNYKISYLADESGFSSHSKFSSNFRQVVGVTPSEFIDSIKN